MKIINSENLKRIGLLALNIISPKTCLFCKKDQRYDYNLPLCKNCLNELEPIVFPYCQKCGINLNSGGAFCFNCKEDKTKKYLSFSRSAFKFNSVLKEVIHTFKYNGYKNTGKWLGRVMAERFSGYKELQNFDFLLPVPISQRRRKERGFNQSEILAKEISQKIGLPFFVNILIKSKETKSQVGLNREKREKNLLMSFSCINSNMVKNRKIIVIDDVATTLSTLNEVARTLKEAGAGEVAGYTLAKE